jgi:hypothetical protein
LQTLLSRREDLPEPYMRQLMAIATETARRRLAQTMPESAQRSINLAVEQSARTVESAVSSGRDYGEAFKKVHAISEDRRLEERDLVSFASQSFEETVCAVAVVVGLSIAASERLFDGSETDLLLVVGKSQGWAWRTLRSLLQLRGPQAASPQNLRRAQEVYDQLAPATAQRVVHFLKVREEAERRAAEEAAAKRQVRSNVK